jgi:uncharacterized protein involved in exopolysaccharide biosynthesis
MVDQLAVPDHNSDVREFRLSDVLAMLLRGRKTILMAVFVSFLIGVFVVFTTPPAYTTQTVLISPPQSQSLSAVALMAGPLAGALPGLSSAAGPTRLLAVISGSRALSDSMVVRLVRDTLRDREMVGAIRYALGEGTRLQNNADGSVVIQVTAHDREVAAQVANAFPALLNEFITWISIDAAEDKSAFLLEQLSSAREALRQSEEALVKYQSSGMTPAIEEQASRTVDAAAMLQQRIIEEEIRLAQLRRTATPENRELTAMMAHIAVLQQELQQLLGGTNEVGQVFVPLSESPELRAGSMRLMREFTRNEEIYIALSAALAESQLQTRNQMPTVIVLDPAPVPTAPSGVGPVVLLVTWLMAGLLIGCGAVLVWEYAQRVRLDPEFRPVVAEMNDIAGDLSSLVPGSRRRHQIAEHATLPDT